MALHDQKIFSDLCISCNLILARISPVKGNYMTWKIVCEIYFLLWNGLHDWKNLSRIALVNILSQTIDIEC